MKGVDKAMNVIEKKKKVMTSFIEATEDLMKEDDIDKISIRKIAKRAGYNSATLYYYFEEIEILSDVLVNIRDKND